MHIVASLFFMAILLGSLSLIAFMVQAHAEQILSALKGHGTAATRACALENALENAPPLTDKNKVIILFKSQPKEKLLELPLAA
jgi:hypothetical protein